MPVAFSDFGVRCRNCGKFINLFAPTLPALSDPFRATCPYCETVAEYERSAVHHVSGLKRLTGNQGLVLAAVLASVILLLAVLYSMR